MIPNLRCYICKKQIFVKATVVTLPPVGPTVQDIDKVPKLHICTLCTVTDLKPFLKEKRNEH